VGVGQRDGIVGREKGKKGGEVALLGVAKDGVEVELVEVERLERVAEGLVELVLELDPARYAPRRARAKEREGIGQFTSCAFFRHTVCRI